jgi:hypothetical protein
MAYLGAAKLAGIWRDFYLNRSQTASPTAPPNEVRKRIKNDLWQGNLYFIPRDAPEDKPENIDQAIRTARTNLQMHLRGIIQEEQKEKTARETEYKKLNTAEKTLVSTAAALTGLGKAAKDFLIWADNIADVIDLNRRAVRIATAAKKSYWDNNKKTWGQNLAEAEYKELIEALGFDPAKITRAQIVEALELAQLIWDDTETRNLLKFFATDYAKAQHHTEWTEMAGSLGFEIILTLILAALTGGAAGLAAAAKNISLISRLEKAGQALLTIGKKLKSLKIRAKRKLINSENTLVASGPAPKSKYDKVDEVMHKASEKTEVKPPVKSTLSARQGVPPVSLSDAQSRLNSMSTEIAQNGYQPKYTDAQLKAMAISGSVAKERYHVRFMEEGYQWAYGSTVKDPDNLTGMLGQTLEGKSGTGPKYWSTTFDQIEDADTDPRIISEKLGLDYDPNKKYILAIIDTEKAIPLTGVESVAATFDNVSAFANRELPDQFPKGFTDKVMNEEFQASYAEHFQKAIDDEKLEGSWDTSPKKFEDYLKTTSLNDHEQKLMIDRIKMQKAIGNNQYYEGNGLTKDKISESKNNYGIVETLNFERTPTNLQKLKDANAITIISLGK